MSPVGSGLASYDDQLPTASIREGSLGPHMRLDENRVNLYRDVRAMTVGDVVTINIVMNDKAVLGNSTDRSRDSKVKTEWSFLFDFLSGATDHKWEGAITNDLQSSSSTQGQGSINRSEQIRLSIAAIVTAVLPNGNLVIRGSQEIRVNYEMRVLTIAGIARPRDIAKDNTISYDKIAEARISYGGRGRLSEVQQPAWGQQVYDIFAPF
jgi:flagellar L-ring protein precursor FlgH